MQAEICGCVVDAVGNRCFSEWVRIKNIDTTDFMQIGGLFS
jgi:hypothetical protein